MVYLLSKLKEQLMVFYFILERGMMNGHSPFPSMLKLTRLTFNYPRAVNNMDILQWESTAQSSTTKQVIWNLMLHLTLYSGVVQNISKEKDFDYKSQPAQN